MAPVSEAFTTPARPWARATPPMISSGRLFSVELSSPPIVGPSFDASRSVAVPMMPTSGRIATSDAQNTTVGWASHHSRPMASGTATSSHSRFISRSPMPAVRPARKSPMPANVQQLTKSPRRKPGDSGHGHRPASYEIPGSPNDAVSPGFRPGLRVKRGRAQPFEPARRSSEKFREVAAGSVHTLLRRRPIDNKRSFTRRAP